MKMSFTQTIVGAVVYLSIFLAPTFTKAQTVTFPSPGAQVICGTTTTTLASVTASDGVTIKPYLRLNATCLDTDLALFSVNNPVSFRRPTFCYNNGYFPASYGNPLAISRNSTANGGNCNNAQSVVVSDFSTGTVKPTGLSFIVCDVDNPYDSIQVKVYSQGNLVDYQFSFFDPNPTSSFVFTNEDGNIGNAVSFNGGANGVWGESSATVDWAKGAIQFNVVDESIEIDSVVLIHFIRTNRNDINAAISIGNFVWKETSTLPVSLVSFEAKEMFGSVALNWETAAELNNRGFEIQRSKEGTNWDVISFVGSNAIGGNSTNTLNYQWVDNSPYSGNNYYRLKQIDFDGKSSLSHVITLNYLSEKQVLRIAPNPVSHQVQVSGLKENTTITITSSTGQLVWKEKVQNSSVKTINTSNLKAGMYIITATDEQGNKRSNTMLKQ